MSSRVETIGVDSAAEIAWEKMRQEKIHHLVVMRGKQIIGVVSHRDLGGLRDQTFRKKLVGEVMQEHVVTATPETTVREAANLMRGNSIGCLPIVERGKLVGIVTVSDLLELVGHGTIRPTPKAERWVLRDRGPKHNRARNRARA